MAAVARRYRFHRSRTAEAICLSALCLLLGEDPSRVDKLYWTVRPQPVGPCIIIDARGRLRANLTLRRRVRAQERWLAGGAVSREYMSG